MNCECEASVTTLTRSRVLLDPKPESALHCVAEDSMSPNLNQLPFWDQSFLG
jgi:hypothetical protein